LFNCGAAVVSGGLKVLGLRGMREMKARVSRIRSIVAVQSNETVRAEMQTFLAALASYPDRFASNPRISFEQHWGSLMMLLSSPSAEVPQSRVD
jgi:hypothetical protein